jgi:2-oxoglutarate ferredoxin oxidoreductase subunit alpha
MAGDPDLIIRFAGTAGEGVLTVGDLLGRVLARTGHHVLCTVRYDAEVRGEKLSMSQVRGATAPVSSAGDRPAILVGFGREAVEAHLMDLAPGGLLIYDDKAIDEFGDVTAYRTTAPPGCAALPLSFLEMAWKRAGRTEAANMVVLGAVLEILGLPQETAEAVVRERFGSRGKAAEANLKALVLGREAASAAGISRPLAEGDKRARPFLSGNQAVALGALAAGCRFFAGYPITPASEIMDELARHLPRFGGTVLQLEDEMAALGAVLGASFGGVKAMTSTSGPGLSLMSELINLGAMTEIPAVVVDVQRGGPSTGLPTRPEQSDLQQAVFGVHGESPRVVLAASSVADCFTRTIEAFNLAERCQTPVILLSDQLLGQSRATVEEEDLVVGELEARLAADAEALRAYHRYRDTASGVSPAAVPGTAGGDHFATGLEHGEDGLPDYTAVGHRLMSRKRWRKLGLIRETGFRALGGDGAPRLLIGWGSVGGVLEEAARRLAAEGIATGAIVVERLHPWPKALGAAVDGRAAFCVEMNFTGQLRTLLRTQGVDAALLPWTGGGIAAEEICDWVRARAREQGGS